VDGIAKNVTVMAIGKVEAPVVDHLSEFRADGEEYEVVGNFLM